MSVIHSLPLKLYQGTPFKINPLVYKILYFSLTWICFMNISFLIMKRGKKRNEEPKKKSEISGVEPFLGGRGGRKTPLKKNLNIFVVSFRFISLFLMFVRLVSSSEQNRNHAPQQNPPQKHIVKHQSPQ